jgi:hypothetical protein
MEHNTDNTVNFLQTYLEDMFSRPVHLEVVSGSDHDGRDGEPVASVMVDHEFDLYPIMGEKRTIAGSRPMVRWAIDRLVDASDPSVGLYGCEPVEHSLHDSLSGALVELARLIAESRAIQHLQVEADRRYAEEMDRQRDLERDLAWS